MGTADQPGSNTAAGSAISTTGVVAGTVLRPLNVEEQAPAPNVWRVQEHSWSQARTREQMRSVLAASLVLLLAVVTVLPLLFAAYKLVPIDDLDTLLKVVFAPVVALVGSVVGFYFGAEVASRDQGMM